MNWISVEDRLPEDGEHILVYGAVFGMKPGPYVSRYRADNRGFDMTVLGFSIGNASHWMPIEPPDLTP